ncbi:MAG: hypothetical protein DRH21_04730 [Deltaproteobacteria bacterium]|nr:MAG: hypothetical protein DRH21_04730 [Deltaproteobacteria bacterium]
MSKDLVIAHDVGTSSNKAVLIDEKGTILATAEEFYQSYYPNPGWVEQQAEDYWEAIVKSTRHMLENSNADPSRIVGMVFTTQAMGIIPVDKLGNTLRKNITWVDGRAEKQARWAMKRFFGRKAFKAMIGIEITGKDVIPKLAWLKKRETKIYENAWKFLDVNGYLKFKATGKMVAEWSGACSYAFNLKKKDWEKIFFRVLGIDVQKLPALVKSIDRVGDLTREAAKACGLPEGLAVYGGCDDTQSAAVGSGAILEGEAHIYLGTSAWVGVTTRRAPKFKNGAVCLQSADPKKNLVVGITESAGANLEWLIERFYIREKAELKEDIYELLDKEASQTPPGSDHLIFTPWLLGERYPVSTTQTRGTIFNLSLEHTRGHFVRALSEGIAYNLRWIIENFEKDFGFRIPNLKVTGGGSQNDHWMQIIADITQRKIEATDRPKMAGAIGAAVIAFVGSGIYPGFEKVKDLVKVRKVFEPNPDHKDIYHEMFENYKDLYHSLKKTYRKANEKRFSL